MKKWLVMGCFLILTLLIFCSSALSYDYSPDDGHDHYALCDNPGVCAACGAPYSGFNLQHDFDYSQYRYDDRNHWTVCTRCGAETEHYPHHANCDNPTVCAECGGPYSGIFVNHDYDYSRYVSDATGHWHVCQRCGGDSYHSSHFANCDDPTVCVECHATNCENAYLYHSIDYSDFKSDAYAHWHVCTKCGETDYRERHTASCLNPGVCTECGQACSSAYTGHRYDYSQYSYNQYSHWHACLDCGHVPYRSDHWASCSAPGVCEECGAPYTGGNMSHIGMTSVLMSDSEKHWRVCSECGQRVNEENHVADCGNPSVCVTCGASCTGARLNHNANIRQYDGTYHWYACACGAKIEYRREHYVSCVNPGVCVDCGAPCANTEIEHNYTNQSQYDATHHWRTCQDCGSIVKEAHYAFCGDPGYCAECGQPFSGGILLHQEDYSTLHYNSESHWNSCICGEKRLNVKSHRVTCGSNGQCMECGVTLPNAQVSHVKPYYVQYQWIDSMEHAYTCLYCGQQIRENHSTSCLNPGRCSECGGTCDISLVEHVNLYSDLSFDPSFHWTQCEACMQEVYKAPHTFENGYCVYCGYKQPNFNACGEHLTWAFAGGKLSIIGTGPMWDYSLTTDQAGQQVTTAPWAQYSGQIRFVELNGTVTSIGRCAFPFTVQDVTFQGTRAKWHYVAIAPGNDSLQTANLHCLVAGSTIYLPLRTATLEDQALYGTAADQYVIPSGVTAIPAGTFANLQKPAVIQIPASVTQIDGSAFSGSQVVIQAPASSYAKDFADQHRLPWIAPD